jgi:hypothetical protein
MRSAKEAIKAFVQRLDPKYDQVGLVTYDDATPQKTELECLRHYPATCVGGGSNPISFTNVLKALEDVDAAGGTYTSWGMKSGLEVLGLNPYNVSPAPTNYGRGSAASKVMILVTDGVPYPPGSAYPAGACTSDWYPYAGAPGAVSTAFEGDDADPNSSCPDGNCDGNDCMLWFAEDARAHGVALYTIGFGYGVNSDLLRETARRGNGDYYFTPSGADLPLVMDAILSSTTASCSALWLSMTPDSAQTGLPGQGLVYTHTLTNRSLYPATVTLTYSADPAGWPVSVSPASQPLEPGQAVTVTASITVPPGSMESETNVMRLVATLQEDESISATVADTTTTGLQRGVDVEPSQAASGLPGHVVTYTHVVTNTGNGLTPEGFTIGAVTGRWTPAWQPPTLSLAAGASAPLTVTLLIPAGTLSGTLDVLTVTVASQADPGAVFDMVTDTTTAGRLPPLYLPIVYKGG